MILKRKIKVIFLIVLFSSVIIYFWKTFDNKKPVIYFPDVFFEIEIAKSESEKIIGLSNREYLDKRKGLFFINTVEDYHGIWMKDMLFPIDIIWLDKNLIVVDIRKNVMPDSYPEIFYPKEKSLYILEINAGLSEKYNIENGTKAMLINN